ncbi:MAG: response regulator transcription factor [Chloroflexi bacterium]|nr:response regulator transcription factor [Chloroflexota bacterium]
MKVLIVEDNPHVVDAIQLCIAIRWPDSEVVATDNGNEAVGLVETEHPDVVILDLGLPDTDGLTVLQDIRRFSDVSLLVVSGNEDIVTRVKALEMGADDYIVKPFSHTEVLARIKAVLRRTQMPNLWSDEGIFRGKDFSIDLNSRRVVVQGKEVSLSAMQWRMLAYLLRNEGKVIPTQVLSEKVWGSEHDERAAIKMCVRRLRQKLGDDPLAPKILLTHRGLGYSLQRSR